MFRNISSNKTINADMPRVSSYSSWHGGREGGKECKGWKERSREREIDGRKERRRREREINRGKEREEKGERNRGRGGKEEE
jgi:hypothetical protein